MLNKFLKFFFFISLSIAIAIVVLTTLDATSHIFGHMLVAVDYASHGEISTAVIAFFPIAVTVLCGLLALIATVLAVFIRRKQAVATPKVTKFFLYYFIALIVISLLVLLSCVLAFNIAERQIWIGDVLIVALLYSACIVEALVVAAFLVSFFTLWKTNRLTASIIGIIILLLIPANYISGHAVYAASSYAYHHNDYGYPYLADSDVVVEEYTDKVFEDYPDDVEEDYLSFLWGEGEYGVGGAANVLFNYDISAWSDSYPQSLLFDVYWTVNMLQNNDTGSYSGKISDESEKRASLNKIYSYLIEHPSEAVEALASYKDLLYYYMPVEKFYGTAAYQLLSYLSAAHNDLYSDSDLTRLGSIYKLMTNIEHDESYEYYDDIKLHVNENYLSKFNDNGGDFYQGGLVWAYSFWARRNAEGTDNIAYTILNMLKEYYSEAEYYQDYDGEEGDDYEEVDDYDGGDDSEVD